MGADSPVVEVTLNGTSVGSNLISVVISRDMGQPDALACVVSNQNDIYADLMEIGATVEVTVGTSTKVFVGEVVGYEPQYKGGEKTTLQIRGYNKFHRLSRKKKSVTFQDKTDQAIIEDVCKGYTGLTADWKHAKSIEYKHVYQHNLTDLEFVRVRAARMGCHVWCVDSKLNVKEPDFGNANPTLKLSVDADGDLHTFTPRMSSAAVVNKVTVKGWNPETKELITGDSGTYATSLGRDDAIKACSKFGKEDTFTVDHPIWSKEEAVALAIARCRDLNMTFITGEAECGGKSVITANTELGQTVEITSNSANANDPFNGNYYIMGLEYRYTQPKGKDGGLMAWIRFARDARCKR